MQPTTFEEQIFLACVDADDVCFDVGANVGDVSIFLARLVAARGPVIAFEPVLSSYFALCRNIQADVNGKAPIISLPMGLSDAVGERAMSTPNGEHWLASLASSAVWEEIHHAPVATQRCNFTTLDAILADQRFPRPGFVKIDVEGAELYVLQGGAQAFARGFRPLMLIELFAPWQRAFGYGPWQVLGFLSELGYHFFFACPAGLISHVPSRSSPFPAAYEHGYNIVAYLPEEHARRAERLARLTAGYERILPMRPAPVPNTILEEHPSVT